MKKLCFVLTVSTGINYGSIFTGAAVRGHNDLRDYFSKYYDVSINEFDDNNSADYLVIPDPFVPFDNKNNLPIIKVPAKLFMTKDFEGIKTCIDHYFATIQEG